MDSYIYLEKCQYASNSMSANLILKWNAQEFKYRGELCGTLLAPKDILYHFGAYYFEYIMSQACNHAITGLKINFENQTW